MMKWLFILALLFSSVALSAEIGSQFELSSPACLPTEFADDHQWLPDNSESSDGIGLTCVARVPSLAAFRASLAATTDVALSYTRVASPIRAPPVVLLD